MTLTIQDLLEKKRDGKTLIKEEVEYLEKEIGDGNIKNAQLGAIRMAIDINGLIDDEAAWVKNPGSIKDATQNLHTNLATIIKKKRDGEKLTGTEIEQFVNDVSEKEILDEHIGAMMMAMYINGLDDDETATLTDAMTNSGMKLQWPEKWRGIVVDKHSTGGVGDKVSLVLAPALAACGLKVPMISGRGLNHTGGTLDKLESIPGFKVTLTEKQMEDALNGVGCCIVGQSEDFVPADKIFYRIRDETCTVNNDGLITGSIISKKAAESLDALVLDVKVGKGAFRKDMDSARELAEKMVKAGNSYGIKTIAILSKMDAPLGHMVGNSLEVAESIKCLHGEGPVDLTQLVLQLGAQLLVKVGKSKTMVEAQNQLKATLDDGTAVKKFCEMIKAQGVEPKVADDLCAEGYDVFKILPKSKHNTEISATKSGLIHDIDAMKCANVATQLGAGRTKAGEKINFGVGLEVKAVVGQVIKKGDILVVVHHDEKELAVDQIKALHKAFTIDPRPASTRVIEIIENP